MTVQPGPTEPTPGTADGTAPAADPDHRDSARPRVALVAPGHRRLPALDGLRGVAALAVVVFHAGVVAAGGWFLGVSLFLTLSGFLVTRTLVNEFAHSGRIDLRAYWSRRARRLLPASYLVLLILGLAAPAAGVAGSGFGGDLLASVFGVMNWRLILTDRPYGSMFGDTSPLTHYWSLGVEEQLYLGVALLLALTVALGPRMCRAILIGLAAVSVGVSVWRAGGDPTRLYYGTDVRAAELLIGAAVGLAWRREGTALVRRACRWLAYPAILTIGVLWSVADVNAAWLYRGGLTVHALCVVVVIVHLVDGGPLSRVLSSRVLRLPGVWSYGIYLIHFPVMLLLRDRVTTEPLPLLGLTLAITLPLAATCHRFIEVPVQQRRVLTRPGLALASVAAVVAGLAVWGPAVSTATASATAEVLAEAPESPSLVVRTPSATGGTEPPPHATAPPSGAPPTTDREVPSASLPVVAQTVPGTEATVPPSTLPPPGAPAPSTTAPPEPPVAPAAPPSSAPPTTVPVGSVLLAGDSMSWVLYRGFDDQGATGGVAAASVPAVGCGIGRPERRIYLGTRMVPQRCATWRRELSRAVAQVRPDRLVMLVGLADLSDARPPGWKRFGHIGEPEFDEWLLDEMRTMVSDTANGVPVVWLTFPTVTPRYVPGETGRPPFAEADPTRVQALNALIRRLGETTPGVTVMPFDEWVAALPGGADDPANRADDGVHLTPAANTSLADRLVASLTGAGG